MLFILLCLSLTKNCHSLIIFSSIKIIILYFRISVFLLLSSWLSGKLCYLDFGMVSYVESSQRYSIIEAVVHLVNRDFVSLAELYRRMGFIPLDVDTAPIVLGKFTNYLFLVL